MKLKIYSIALLTLLNFTVNAVKNDNDSADGILGKRKIFETTEDEKSAKIFCAVVDDNIVIADEENNNNIIDDTEYKDPIDDGIFFHDRYQNSYNLLSNLEKWKKRILLVAKIDDINAAFKNDTINKSNVTLYEITRRKNIIKAVSETFNIKLLSHFGYVSQAENEDDYNPLNELNTNDIINPSDDVDINDDYIEYLIYRCYDEDDIELVRNFEVFSLDNMNYSYLHPENFNELLIYFPWVKKIGGYFDIRDSNYSQKIFNNITELFSNIEHLKKIETISFRQAENTKICFSTSHLPKWAHKIEFDVR